MEKKFTVVVTHEGIRRPSEDVRLFKVTATTPWGAINKARAEYEKKGYDKMFGRIKNITCLC